LSSAIAVPFLWYFRGFIEAPLVTGAFRRRENIQKFKLGIITSGESRGKHAEPPLELEEASPSSTHPYVQSLYVAGWVKNLFPTQPGTFQNDEKSPGIDPCG